MLRLFRFLRFREWVALFIGVVFIVVQVYLELKIPDYTKNLATIVSSPTATSNEEVWKNGGMMLLCSFGAMGCAVAASLCTSFLASNFSATLRDKLFTHIMSFSNREIHQFHTASLITRTTNDIVQIQMILAMGGMIIVRAPVMAIWALTKISAAEVSWTAATAICLGVILITLVILIVLCLPKFKKIQALTDALNAAARENVSGVRVIRAFNAEEFQQAKYEKANEDITRNNLFTSRGFSALNPIINAAMNGLILAIYVIGAVLINNIQVDSSMSPEAMQTAYADRVNVIANMTAFSQYALQVVMSFLMIVAIFVFLPRTIVSARRVNEVLDTKPTILDGEKDSCEDRDEIIRFDNVDFSYANSDHYAVSGISLSIKQGETVAFIGATGCGKTTIMNLLLRFYEVSGGSISVKGIDVRDLTLSALRHNISFAPQKASLFRGTVRNNVAFGDKNPSEEKIDAVLGAACCDFVESLEGGKDFEISANGTNLSGGQKQRISIARALYKDTDILVFDDTFSALDFKTDRKIRENLKSLFANKTVLIVAQRIGTIRNADKIVVMDKGRIVGVGKHEELIASNDVYREIALSQLDKEEL